MSKKISKETEKTLSAVATGAVIVATLAEIVFVSKLFTLVSRGNKALKIYIEKNKKPKRKLGFRKYDDDFFDEDCFDEEYCNEDDISF